MLCKIMAILSPPVGWMVNPQSVARMLGKRYEAGRIVLLEITLIRSLSDTVFLDDLARHGSLKSSSRHSLVAINVLSRILAFKT